MNIILEIIQLRKMKTEIKITKNGEILELPIKKLSLAIFYTRLFFLEKSIKRYAMWDA